MPRKSKKSKKMTDIMRAKPTKGCPHCGAPKHEYRTEGERRAHMKWCHARPDGPRRCEFCGKPSDAFSHRQSFYTHVSRCRKKAKEGEAKRVKKFEEKFPSIVKKARERLKKPDKKIKDKLRELNCRLQKDTIRHVLQDLALLHLKAELSDKKTIRAIGLPGKRPESESLLLAQKLDGFGATEILMVEQDKKIADEHKGVIIHGEFFRVLKEQGMRDPFSIVDYDICGRPGYAEGSFLAHLMRSGLVTSTFCLRITFCLRTSKGGPPRADMDQLDHDIRHSANVTSYEAVTYRSPSGVVMEVRQWVLTHK